jgi:hypothetical protein
MKMASGLVLTASLLFTIATLVFTPYSYFKRGRTTKSQKLIFQKTTVLLCLNSIQHMLLATLIDKLKVL